MICRCIIVDPLPVSCCSVVLDVLGPNVMVACIDPPLLRVSTLRIPDEVWRPKVILACIL